MQLKFLCISAAILACAGSGFNIALADAATTTPIAVVTTTQNAGVQVTIVKNATAQPEIEFNLEAPAKVQILNGTTVLLSTTLPTGLHYVNTSGFPVGHYAVNVKIQTSTMTYNISQNLSIVK